MAAPPSSAPACSGERWPPLESSPDVFNQFMWSLGVPRGEAEFHDVYGLDADALEMVPQPVLAVVFCFPDPPQDPTNPPEEVLATEERETSDDVFFIKQIEPLGNACGTIALLHAVGNAYSESLLENSCLDLFFKSTASMDPYERARVFEKDDDIARAHSLAASAGDTELPDDVEEHYICFMALNGTLYELDGMKGGPVKHGSTSPESLLQDAVHIIKAIIHKIPNSMNFNVMVLSTKPKSREERLSKAAAGRGSSQAEMQALSGTAWPVEVFPPENDTYSEAERLLRAPVYLVQLRQAQSLAHCHPILPPVSSRVSLSNTPSVLI